MQPDLVLLQILPPALLAVDQNDGVADLQPGGTERCGGFKNGGAAGDEVVAGDRVSGAERDFRRERDGCAAGTEERDE